MKTPFCVGEMVYLRPLAPEDINEKYVAWVNDPDVGRYLEVTNFPRTLEQIRSYYEQISAAPNEIMLAIVDKQSDLHIGNIKLGPINWVHRKATLGILLGERAFWGRGVGAEATRLMVEYGFFRLNLHRIDLGVFSEHAAAIRCYEKVGFKPEGRLREALYKDGAFTDHISMGLLRSEYQKP